MKTSVLRLIASPVYRGISFSGAFRKVPGRADHRLELEAPGAIVVPSSHVALVDESTWKAANQGLSDRATGGGRRGVLTGLLWINGMRAQINGTPTRSYCVSGTWVRLDLVNSTVWHAL